METTSPSSNPTLLYCTPFSLEAILHYPINESKLNQKKLLTDLYIKSSLSQRKGPTIINKIKTIVSKNKKRFTFGDFDLDLTYITPRIIAMGLPSSNIEGLYRNSMNEVKQFFQQRHPNHYKVYNLCDEKSYAKNTFHKQATYPFKDHEAPPLNILLPFCEDAASFLKEDNKNVVAVHCLAGKGRTGTFVSCLLLYLKEFETATECLRYFGMMRVNNGKGVTMPSQIRYVYYFESLLVNKIKKEIEYGNGIKINKIRMISVPNFGKVTAHCEPTFKIETNDNKYKWSAIEIYKCNVHKYIDFDLSRENGFIVKGDVKVKFEHKNSLGIEEVMFKFWFNTMFIPDNGVLSFPKSMIDNAVNDTECKRFKNNFGIEIFYDFIE